MLTGAVEGRFLEMLVWASGARRVLEIGTYSGYSALSMAAALPDDGVLITCDVWEEAHEVAKRYAAESPHGHKIDFRLGPALETIENSRARSTSSSSTRTRRTTTTTSTRRCRCWRTAA